LNNRWIAAGATWAAIAIILAVLASGLPADTFYTGDPGVKLVAARNAATHAERPLEIPLPKIGTEPVPYVDPFFVPHGSHSHAITSELFPLLTAPFIGALGIRGIYVLPALGLLTTLAATAWLGVLLDHRRSAPTIMMTALLGTPLLFYGLEFWEHAPAAGAAALAAALFAASTRTRDTLTFGLAGLAGVLFGIAVLLRPEAIWFAAAVIAAGRWLPQPAGPARSVAVVLGLALPFLPLLAYTAAHFGTFVTPHVAGNPAIWEAGWLGRRLTVARQWFVSVGPANVWIVAPALLAALLCKVQPTPFRGRRFLAISAGVGAALTFLTVPNDGGGQWGPRYLLPAFMPLSVIASDFAQATWQQRHRPMVLVLIALVAGGGWVQRMSYQRLRSTKETYGRMLDFVEAMSSAPAGHVVTDLWWLDQIAAAASSERVFLYAADAAVGATILQQLDEAMASTVTIVGSRDESSDQHAWIEGTCYVVDEQREIPDRRLVAARLARIC
jgi:hypothetical protein